MRNVTAGLLLAVSLIAAGCTGRPAGPAGQPAPTVVTVPDPPAPAAAEPTAGKAPAAPGAPSQPPAAPAPSPAPAPQPAPEPMSVPPGVRTPEGKCGETALALVRAPGSWELTQSNGFCYGLWRDEATGYRIQGTLLQIVPNADFWSVYEVYPFTDGPQPITVQGEEQTYPGLLQPAFFEKTGAEFWGPRPLEAVFVTERGSIQLTCSPERFARTAEEGEEASRQLAQLCPELLGSIRLGALGKPIPPSFIPPALTDADRERLKARATEIFRLAAAGEVEVLERMTTPAKGRYGVGFFSDTEGEGLPAVARWAARAGEVRSVDVGDRRVHSMMDLVLVRTDGGDFAVYLTIPLGQLAKIFAVADFSTMP